MKHFIIFLFGLWPAVLWGQLTLNPEPGIQAAFCAEPVKLKVGFSNPKNEVTKTPLRTRVYQKSSATLMPVGEIQPWKEVRLLEGQSVIETVSITFPEIKAPTRFQVHVLGEQTLIGKVEVDVYPPNLLKQISLLLGESKLAIFDPQNHLKPSFVKAGIAFEDLQSGTELDVFQGKLAIFNLTPPTQRPSQEFEAHVHQIIKRGIAVIWIRPETENHQLPAPLTMVMREGIESGVLIKTRECFNLSEPSAQMSLLYLAGIALTPDLTRSLLQ